MTDFWKTRKNSRSEWLRRLRTTSNRRARPKSLSKTPLLMLPADALLKKRLTAKIKPPMRDCMNLTRRNSRKWKPRRRKKQKRLRVRLKNKLLRRELLWIRLSMRMHKEGDTRMPRRRKT